jgi:hypothetical protein
MWSRIKRIIGVAGPVALEFVPAKFEPVARTVYAGVQNAEAAGGTAETKLAIAMRYVKLLLPAIAETVEKITGKDVVDEVALASALEHLASFQVQITKAVGRKPL